MREMIPSPDVDPLDQGHPFLRIGMHRTQVLGCVGAPYFDDARGNLHYYSVASRMHLRLRFAGDELVEIITPSTDADRLDQGHPFLRIGMRLTQVLGLVGAPYFDDVRGNLHYYSVASRLHLRLRFVGDELVEIIHPE